MKVTLRMASVTAILSVVLAISPLPNFIYHNFSVSKATEDTSTAVSIHQKIVSDFSKPFFKRPVAIIKNASWTLKADDINRDGLSDIVAMECTPSIYPRITIFFNCGDNSFEKRTIFVSNDSRITGEIDDIDVVDYDCDGDIDIMFTCNEHVWYHGAPINVNGSVYVLRNDGSCHFDKIEQILWLGPGEPGSPDNWINLDVGCGDFDKDGDVDFVVGGNCGWVSFYKNDGTGHFTLAKKIYDYGNYTWDFAVADFNNDGWLDFVVASENATYLKLNNHKEYCFDYGPGIKILQHIPFGFEIGPMGPAAIAPIDYNNDGKEDIILMCLHTIYLLMNYGNLSFVPIPVSYMFGEACLLGKGVETADLNQDGWEDLLIGSGGGKIYLLSNNRTFILISCPIDKLVYLKGSIFFGLPPKWWGKCIIIGNITFKAVPLEPLDRVEFYVNGKLVENDTEPPYEWTWNIRNFLPKWYTVDAVAYRQNGEYGGRYRLEVLKIL